MQRLLCGHVRKNTKAIKGYIKNQLKKDPFGFVSSIISMPKRKYHPLCRWGFVYLQNPLDNLSRKCFNSLSLLGSFKCLQEYNIVPL